MIDLNILIPTIPSRKDKLERLMEILNKQRVSNLLITVLDSDETMNIGAKRNLMLEKAQGRYISFIDDDDTVSDEYITDILSSIENKQPDVIGFKVAYFADTVYTGIIDQSTKYKDFKKELFMNHSGTSNFIVKKPVNHLNPIKIEIAKSVGFPDLKYGEDKIYSMMIQNRIRTSDYIDKYLYNYLWESKDNSLSKSFKKNGSD